MILPTTREEIDAQFLTSIIREHLDSDQCEVTDFIFVAPSGRSVGGGTIHRCLMTYQDTRGQHKTSLILKEIRQPGNQSQDVELARRKMRCYQERIFDDLPDCLYVPRAIYILDRPETAQHWIFMEDLAECFEGIQWGEQEVCQAIRDLTGMHALWWGRGEELRAKPWLSQRALNMYQYIWDTRIRRHLAQVADHPRLGGVLTPPRRALIERLLGSCDRVYDRLDELPQTLLHHDFWTGNLGQRRLGGRTQTCWWTGRTSALGHPAQSSAS